MGHKSKKKKIDWFFVASIELSVVELITHWPNVVHGVIIIIAVIRLVGEYNN